MAIMRVTLRFAGPVLLPEASPALPDTWLQWAFLRLTGHPDRRPTDPDWVSDPPLPVARDAATGLWAVSALTFPDPGVQTANRGYRTVWTPADRLQQQPAAPLYRLDETGTGPFRAMTYDLTAWYTPRAIFWADVVHLPQLTALLDFLVALGVGRKAGDGYGALQSATVDPDPTVASALWTPRGMPRRPIPCRLVSHPVASPVLPFQTTGPRWLGAPEPCFCPPIDTWLPRPWRRPDRTAPAADRPSEEDA
jgi:hypothetical protein